MDLLAGYGGLFAAAFLAATILPAQSELLLSGLILSGHYSLWGLLAVATAGNVAGALVNWVLGRYFAQHKDARWFPVKGASMAKAERWFDRFGPAVLLLSWMPIIGDPLTLVAGVLKMRFLPFLAIVTLAKGGRYLVLAFIVMGLW